MKRSGLVVILVMVVAIVAFSTMAFAFYSSARATFTFTVSSAQGSSIGIDLYTSQSTLRPANTSTQVGNYSAASSNNGEQYAVYILSYVATSQLNISFHIDNVTYTQKTGDPDFSASDIAYLDDAIDFYLVQANNLNTYNLNNLHTIANNAWIKQYDNTDATTKAATSYTVASLSEGSGYLFCYIRFNKSQELIPPKFDGMHISFLINTTLNS